MDVTPPSAAPCCRAHLKRGRARPFFGRHPWVFAGAIAKVEGEPADGDAVDLYSDRGEFIGRGLYNSHSNIRVRLYTWDATEELDEAFWRRRIEAAVRLRREVLGYDDPTPSPCPLPPASGEGGSARGACRLVFSEGDGLSGLVVDRYADWLVVQFTSLALAMRREAIARILIEMLSPRGIYLRTERGVGTAEGLELRDGLLWSAELSAVSDQRAADHQEAKQAPEIVVSEHGVLYRVDLATGQKTGFYLDQRENRMAAARYMKGRSVLDAFCYSGGFGLAALLLGEARDVYAFDTSDAALQLAQANAELNARQRGLSALPIQFERGQAFGVLERLASEGRRFGAVVLDPPKFARSAKGVDEAIGAYHRINRLAVELLQPSGVLVTCSCSGHVTPEMFELVLAGVAEKTGRMIRILERRGQAPDHPISASCLQTAYLKCFVCAVQ